jgi:hypothetical protein
VKLVELAIFYGSVGVGCTVTVLVSRGVRGGAVVDAALLLALWPLYGPFLLLRSRPVVGSAERDVLAALAEARRTPLAPLLPDEQAVRALAGRLRAAGARMAEIDALLAEPAFSEDAARARRRELEDAGEVRAAQMAAKRVERIQRLRVLRDRFAGEIAEIRELSLQLRMQAELVRLAGAEGQSARDLSADLLARLEGLDEILGTDAREGSQ